MPSAREDDLDFDDWESDWAATPDRSRPGPPLWVRAVAILVVLGLLLGAAAALIGVVLSGGDDDADTAWSERLAPATTPAGFRPSIVYSSADLLGAGGDGRAVVYAEPGAWYADGRWVAVAAVPAGPEIDPADPDGEFSGEDRRPVEVGGVPGVGGVTYDGRPGIVFGPVDGGLVSIVGHGVELDELLDLAASVTVVDGLPRLADPGALDAVTFIEHATTDVVTSLASAALAPGEGAATIAYNPDAGTTPLQVTNRPTNELVAALVAFLLGPDSGGEVAGRDGHIGTFTLADYTLTVVTFERGGRLVTVASERSPEQLLAVAADVVELTPEGWEALRAEAALFLTT